MVTFRFYLFIQQLFIEDFLSEKGNQYVTQEIHTLQHLFHVLLIRCISEIPIMVMAIFFHCLYSSLGGTHQGIKMAASGR
jgi:K+-transporting ATPase A subunit